MRFFTRVFGLFILYNILVMKSYLWESKYYFYIEVIGIVIWMASEYSWVKERRNKNDKAG